MAREELLAEEIQRIVQQQVDHLIETRQIIEQITVPLPLRVLPTNGCNWSMEKFGTSTPAYSSIKKLVLWARGQFNLPKQS